MKLVRFLSSALLLCLAFAGAISAQTVQIGTGTDVPANTLYGPVYRYSATSTTSAARCNMVFTQSEMSAAGIPSGAIITAVQFNKVNSANFVTAANFEMLMANTSNTSLATTLTWASIQGSHTSVYSNSSFNVPLAAGWVTITLSTPFTYTGGALEIATDLSMTGNGGATDKFQWEYTASIPADKIVGVASAGATLNGTVAAYKHRPNIKITYLTPTPCTTPPTAGTATTSATALCSGSSVTLGLTGNSSGIGQSYQWQRSTTSGGTYSNIGTSSNLTTLTTSPTATYYYRAAVTCGTSTTYSAPVLVTAIQPLSGTYTINSASPTGGTNFQTYNDAVTALGCGIAGPVVFDVVAGSGPYNEQVVLPPVSGASATNTITFNGHGTTLSYGSTVSAQRAVLKLDGADFIILDSLIIDASIGTYGYGIQLINDADNNIIRKCTVNSSTGSTSSNFGGIIISGSHTSATTTGSDCDNNTISNNKINGGYYGITMMGSSTARIVNNKIVNNVIQNFYYYGINVDGHDNLRIEGNDISRPTRTDVSVFYGIDMNNVINTRVNANRMHNPADNDPSNTSTQYGISITASDPVVANANIISNNLIYGFTRGGTQYGIYNSSSDNALYYHNTISLEDGAYTGSSATRGFYQTTAASGIKFMNNIVRINRGGSGDKYCIYMATATTTYTSNRNVLINNSTGSGINAVGYANGNAYATLADWQSATSQDANSLIDDPLFVNPATGNFTPTNTDIDNEGTPVNVLTDITGAARSATTPDIGAIEFTPPPCTAPPTAGNAVASVPSVCLGSSVTLSLNGNSIGSGQTYQWQTSTTALGTYTNIGTAQTKTKLVWSPTTTLYYRAAITCGTNTVYSAPVRVFIGSTMAAGTYTINNAVPTGGTNFESFTDAVYALKCGIAGPVFFDVADGVYNEQISIDAVTGASATNRVTFRAISANANGVQLTFAPNNALNNYIVKLNSASYISFKGIAMYNTSTTFGHVVEISGSSAADSIVSCRLNAPQVTSSSDDFAALYTDGVTGANNVIYNNYIHGGSYGMRIYGVSTSSLIDGWVIEKNSVIDVYYYSIYLRFTDNLKLRDNIVSTISTSTTHYCVYAYYNDNAFEVTGNKLTATTGGTRYGLNIYYSDGTATKKGLISNNVVALGDGTSTVYGIRVQYNNFMRCYNNSVNINGDGSGAAGYFYYTAAYEGNEIRNNIFSNIGIGAALYVYNPDLGTNNTLDYNNIYSADNLVERGSPATVYKKLSEWRIATGQDKNSISYNPGFTNATDLTPDPANPASWSVNGRGVHISGNNKDINGNTRVVSLADGVPDLGAYEFTPTSTPPVADAIPASPANGVTQIFLFGQDTIAKISWSATSLLPPAITVRQYTGTIPPQLSSVSPASYMYFYTDIDVQTTTYDFGADIYYKNPWMGTVSSENNMRMVKKFNANPWVAYNGTESIIDADRNIISAAALTSHGYFSGIDESSIFSSRIKLGGKATFCPGGTVRLFATPSTGFTYRWKLNGTLIPGATASYYDANGAGIYEVEIVNGTTIAATTPIELYSVAAPAAVVTPQGATNFCPGNNVILAVNTGANTTYQWRLNGVNIPGATAPAYTATSAGIYTVEATNLGCSATSPATVVTVGPPAVNLGRDTAYCEAGSITLDAGNPGATYLWSTGETTRTIVASGSSSNSYSVVVSTGPGCAAGDTVSISINPLPSVVGISYVRSGNNFQFTPSGDANVQKYLWIFNDGTTDPNRVVTKSYTNRPESVKLVVFNACGTDTVETNLSLSVNDNPAVANTQLTLYPNPAQSIVTVALEGNADMKGVAVINHLGQVVYQALAESNVKTMKIDVSYLPNGHYMLRVSTSAGTVITKQLDILK